MDVVTLLPPVGRREMYQGLVFIIVSVGLILQREKIVVIQFWFGYEEGVTKRGWYTRMSCLVRLSEVQAGTSSLHSGTG